MVKKSLIVGLTAIILSLCCGLCFAAEGNKDGSVNLGNEITKSVDKAGQSMQNLTDNAFSTNMVNDVKNGANNMTRGAMNGIDNMTNAVVNTTETRDHNEVINNNDTNRRDYDNNNINGTNNGDYNATRTTAETTNATGFNAMSTTTWMWIILAVAAIIIIAAIWYYATQNND